MLTIEAVNFDCADPELVARFWGQALSREVRSDEPEVCYLTADERGLELTFVRVPEGKAIKNRVHLDLRPDDRDAEVERLLGLGAARARIGQTGEESWGVLADPEGNEFCVLRSASDATSA